MTAPASPLEYQVRLRLRAQDVQAASLGGEQGCHLGWESFLITHPVTEDRTDVSYDLFAAS